MKLTTLEIERMANRLRASDPGFSEDASLEFLHKAIENVICGLHSVQVALAQQEN